MPLMIFNFVCFYLQLKFSIVCVGGLCNIIGYGTEQVDAKYENKKGIDKFAHTFFVELIKKLRNREKEAIIR